MSGKAKKSTSAPTGKPKLSKTKSLVLKSAAKPKIMKRSGSIKEKRSGKATKTKTKSGYSLYTSDSDSGDHVTTTGHGMDRCSELLYHLLDRKKGGKGRLSPSSSPYYGKVCESETFIPQLRREIPTAGPDSPDTMIAALMTGERNTPRTRTPVVDIQTPFNQRLMSSTPDPERLLYDEQLIPVKDVGLSEPLRRCTALKKYMYETEFPVASQVSDPMDLSSLVIQHYTHSPKSSYSRKPKKDKFVCIQSDQEELINSGVHGESDDIDFQCYLRHEATRFSPPLFLQGGREDVGSVVREVEDQSDVDKINTENDDESDSTHNFLSAIKAVGDVNVANSRQDPEERITEPVTNDVENVKTNSADGVTDVDFTSTSRRSGDDVTNPIPFSQENDLHLPTAKLIAAQHQHEPRAILGRQVCKTQTKEETKHVGSVDGLENIPPQFPRSSLSETQHLSPRSSLSEKQHLSPDTEPSGAGYEDDSTVPYRHINQCTLNPNVGISKPLPFLHDFVETPANSPVNISAKTGNPALKSKVSQSGAFVKNYASKRLESCFNPEPRRSVTPPLNYGYTGMDANCMATPANSPIRPHVSSEMFNPYAEQEVMSGEISKPAQLPITDNSTQGPGHVRYLLKELENMGKALGNTDIVSLAQDLHNTLDGMSTFDLMSRVDQLLQPLRNENITLNRRIKTLNQQLRERERMERESSSLGVNFELLNLQADNVSLNRQLREKHESVARFMSLVDELQQEKDQVKKERQQLIVILDEKNKDKVKIREECRVESSKWERKLDMVKKQNEGFTLKLTAAHQENNILEIALKQRDHEITRLEQLVQTLKDGVEGILGSLDANCNIKEPKSAASNTFNLQRMLLMLDRSSSPVKSVMSDPGHATETKASSSKKSLNFDNNLDGLDKKKHLQVSPLTKAALKKHEQQTMKSWATEYLQDDPKHVAKSKHAADKGFEYLQDDPKHVAKTKHAVDKGFEYLQDDPKHVAKSKHAADKGFEYLQDDPKHVAKSKHTADKGFEYVQDEPTHIAKSKITADKGFDQLVQKDNFVHHSRDKRQPVCVKATKVGESRYSSSPKRDELVPSKGGTKQACALKEFSSRELRYGSSPNKDDEFLPVKARTEQACALKEFSSRELRYGSSPNDDDEFLPVKLRTEQAGALKDFSSEDSKGKVENLDKADIPHDSLCYSVSDYFKKYPQLAEPLPCSEDRVAHSETVSKLETKTQSGENVNKNVGTASSSNKPRSGRIVDNDFSAGQEELYKGTELDLSLSTIDFDGRSVASSATSFSTSTTVDDRAFREGIAALDANIAKVQMALQRTKKKFQHVE